MEMGERRSGVLTMTSPLITAFPAQLTPDVSRRTTLLDPPSGLDSTKPFAVRCNTELIQIPYRIYRPIISEIQFASLRSIEQSIAACWFSRHHDGHVRERFLRALPEFHSSWVIAYVVAACGEYVIELLKYIWERRALFDAAVLGCWLRDNPAFYSRTRSRIVSYWNCYYRTGRFEDYVGSHLIAFFEQSTKIEALRRVTPYANRSSK
jgi:hypothetical protein